MQTFAGSSLLPLVRILVVVGRVAANSGNGTESGLLTVKSGPPAATVGNRIGCLPTAASGNRIVVCRKA